MSRRIVGLAYGAVFLLAGVWISNAMKLCDPKHPKHYSISGVGWGGAIGDQPSKRVQSFFNNVTIHSKLVDGDDGYCVSNVTAECDGKFYELFKKRPFCCAKHMQDVVLLKVARMPFAELTHSFPAMKLKDGQYDPLTRAFLLARKLCLK